MAVAAAHECSIDEDREFIEAGLGDDMCIENETHKAGTVSDQARSLILADAVTAFQDAKSVLDTGDRWRIFS